MMLYNTLSRQTKEFKPLQKDSVTVYTCGPTVYDHIHIGNLSAFIAADTLHRTLKESGHKVKHVMNFTDVDDKTIRRSQERFPDEAPELALRKLTNEYKKIFLHDMQAIGNDVEALSFISAIDSIESMRNLINQLYKGGTAYVADDGVYFSIEKYKADGKKYGQLLTINSENTSGARIDNDEYDKESIHDFALWKTRKGDEPAWEFNLDGHNLLGRPGWHIECSVMSVDNLGQPFDIHTGGVDLIFPHHENEIAQSTAGKENPVYATHFFHNEHLLVDGKKMSKSLGNFFTLRDIQEKGFDPMAFRLLVLQSHYRSQSNFSWENLEAASNRLKSLEAMADLKWQMVPDSTTDQLSVLESHKISIRQSLYDDLDTVKALSALSALESAVNTSGVSEGSKGSYQRLLVWLDGLFGLKLSERQDIDDAQKILLKTREQARNSQEWDKSDNLRDQLKEQGIGVRDSEQRQTWFRL